MIDEATEEKIYHLVEIVERQQVIVQDVLEKLVAEREALHQERSEWSDRTGSLADEVHTLIVTTIEENLTSMMQAGSDALDQLSEPLLGSVSQVLVDTKQAQEVLSGLLDGLRWRVLMMGLGAVAGLAFLWWLASSSVLWWDASAIGAAQVRKVQAEAELSRLQANRETWVKGGMLTKIGVCGDRKRACVRVDESAGKFGEQGEYRVLQGY